LFGNRGNWVYLIFFVLAILTLSLGISKHGIGLKNDSLSFIFCAEKLANGEGLTHYDGRVFHEWPPLVPIILAGPMLIGIPPEITGTVMNMVLFGLLAVFTGKAISENTYNNFFIICGMSLAILSRPNYLSSTFLMSEIPFNTFVVASLLSLHFYLKDGKRKYFWILILMTALACLTRYFGITLVITGVVVLFFHGMEKTFRKKIRDPFIFGALSSLPTTIYIMRNYFLTGTFVGDRYPARFGILYNLYRSSYHIVHWVIPRWIPAVIWVPLAFLLILIAAIIAFHALYMIIKGGRNTNIIRIFGYFAVIYFLYLIFSASMVGFDPLNDRFFSPIYVPVIIVMIISLDDMYSKMLPKIMRNEIHEPVDVSRRKKEEKLFSRYIHVKRSLNFQGITGRSISAIPVLVIIWIIGSGMVIEEEMVKDIQYGAGAYTTDRWIHSEILNYLSNNPLEGDLYSNFAMEVKYYSHVDNIRMTPSKLIEATNVPANGLEKFNESIKNQDSIFIIWITMEPGARSWLYSIDELIDIYDLTLVNTFTDGLIYRLP